MTKREATVLGGEIRKHQPHYQVTDVYHLSGNRGRVAVVDRRTGRSAVIRSPEMWEIYKRQQGAFGSF
jgi:hypothetical protein